jgi:lipopolysaccharide transport system ATP-binding protein
MLLDKGQVLKDGNPDEVVDYYNALIAAKENAKLSVEQRREKNGWLFTRSGTMQARVASLELLDADSHEPVHVARVGQRLRLRLIAKANVDIPRLVLGYMLRDRTGHVVWGSNTWHTRQTLEDIKAGDEIAFDLSLTCALGPGSYSFTPALTSSDSHLDANYDWQDNALVFDVVNVDRIFFLGTSALDTEFTINGPDQ